MNFNQFKNLFKPLFFLSLLNILTACSDPKNETDLIKLFEVAEQDIISISFVDSSENTVSINSQVDYFINAVKSNQQESVSISKNIYWSLSDNSQSSIDQNGRLTAGPNTETLTITASIGFLSTSFDVRVSSAKFDRITALHTETISISMCQQKIINPIGLYIDEQGNQETRTVDSTIINSIGWFVVDPNDESISQLAIVSANNNQTRLQTLAAGDVTIRARALSVNSGNEITSEDFSLSIDNTLSQIKLCSASETNLSSCSIETINLEKNASIDIISVARYTKSDGSNEDINITATTKWGLDNSNNASLVASSDTTTMKLNALVANTDVSLSIACGFIEQTVASIENTVILDENISCASDENNCATESIAISISSLTVSSLSVTANDISLTDNESISFSSRPAEIILSVIANFADTTNTNITNDNNLDYKIIEINQNTVIEKKATSTGTFTVLNSGTAKVELDYQNTLFTVEIVIP